MDSATAREGRPARLTDVARLAGVSTATVDRVLHGRSNVRSATAQRVLKAAAELQYLPENDLLRALQPAPMELAFVLPAGTNRYLQMLGDYVGYAHETLAPYNVHCRAHYVDSFDPATLARGLLRHGRGAAGLAFMAIEHPLVREAVATLHARGVHVLTLISDLPGSQRAAYVGLDNRAAGRTAGTSDRPLPRRARRQGGDDRGLAVLPRPRGARDRLPQPHEGRVPGAAGHRRARGTRRRRDQLPPGARAARAAPRPGRPVQHRRRLRRRRPRAQGQRAATRRSCSSATD